MTNEIFEYDIYCQFIDGANTYVVPLPQTSAQDPVKIAGGQAVTIYSER